MSSFSLPQERHSSILSRLEQDGRVLAIDLAQVFAVSEDTVRRDLRDLAAAGLCHRVYGGALRVSASARSIGERSAADSDAKAALGVAAAALIRRGQTIIIDSGSTNLSIARSIPENCGVTVVTNAPGVAALLHARKTAEVIMIGGRVDPDTGASFGARAMRDIADIQADLAFIGACAVSASGVTVLDPEEALFKQAVLRHAAQSIVAVTNAKLSTAAPFRAASFDDPVSLVIEHAAPASLVEALGLPASRVHRAAPVRKEHRS